MAYGQNELLTGLLRDVSRSFYLTLSILPGAIRQQIGLAYLLARTSDTIADTAIIPPESRLQALESLRHRIAGTSSALLKFDRLASHQGSPAERVLLERCESSLTLLGQLSVPDLQLVRWVLDVIVGGQVLDLQRFAAGSQDRIVSLVTDSELDDYTYRVAGCVGEFWTRLCLTHLFSKAGLPNDRLVADGICFGKGLQLVNILRDLPADLQQGRCYIPTERLTEVGISPEALLDPANEPSFRALFQSYLDRAAGYLRIGWSYTDTLPWYSVRVRLACAWPILIGLDTIKLLREANGLDPHQRVKVSRQRVKRIIWRSVVAYAWPPAWNRLAHDPV